MAPSPRPPVPLGDPPRRTGARSRRLSAVAVVATVVALGGAVAGVYTTGVTLGTRIAPSSEADVRGPGGGPGPAGATDTSPTSTTAADSSLPDRAEGDGTTSTGPDPSTTQGGSAGTGTGAPGGTAPVEPYPGLWPYVTWGEVVAHAARADARFRTPEDTALRFASEVVGLTGASVGEVVEDGVVATVAIRSGQGATLVSLTHASPGRVSSATPWSVVEATGDVTLDVPTSASGTLRAATSGRPGVVGVHDRSRWRGIGVAPTPGAAFDVRVDPGPRGPAIAIALAGDPRDPASFTVRRVQLTGGVAAPVAPADPLAATRALVSAVGEGDVGATWELLDPAARRSVLDWRGLAGRIPTLRDRLALFASGSFTTTSVTTAVGTVSVVAPVVASRYEASGPLAALAFRVDGGARLASIEAGSVTWTGPSGDDPSLLASGAVRPLALVVDGAVWASTPDGDTGLRGSAEALAAGPHLAIAISVQDDQVTASAFPFEVTDPPIVPEVDPPADPDTPSDETRSPDTPFEAAPGTPTTVVPDRPRG